MNSLSNPNKRSKMGITINSLHFLCQTWCIWSLKSVTIHKFIPRKKIWTIPINTNKRICQRYSRILWSKAELSPKCHKMTRLLKFSKLSTLSISFLSNTISITRHNSFKSAREWARMMSNSGATQILMASTWERWETTINSSRGTRSNPWSN